MNLKDLENHMNNMTKKEIEAVKQESMSMIKQTLEDLLHDTYINKTTYDDKIFLYVNDLKNAYTLHQIKDIEFFFNEDCSGIEKRYNEIIEHKTYTDKQISQGIFDLVKLKKITRKDIYDKKITI